MHAGMVARAIMEPKLRIPVQVSIASEFRYEEPLIDRPNTGDYYFSVGRDLLIPWQR